jgi:hypothetical protein
MSKIATNKNKIKLRIDELEQQSVLIRKEIEGDLEVSKMKIVDIGKVILGIGGGLIFSAIILGGLSSRKRKGDSESKYKSKRVYHRFRDQLGHELTGQATDFLLGLAKDKLNHYIGNRENIKDDDSSVTS